MEESRWPRYTSWFDTGRRWALNGERWRAIHSETPAIPENETFRRNRSMLMAEQWPQKQLDNSTAGAGTFVAPYVAVCGIATPKSTDPASFVEIQPSRNTRRRKLSTRATFAAAYRHCILYTTKKNLLEKRWHLQSRLDLYSLIIFYVNFLYAFTNLVNCVLIICCS